MKKALICNALYTIKPAWLDITERFKRRYCEKWNIDCLLLSENPYPENHAVWSKPRVMLDRLDNYSWLIWMDADAMPVGMEVDISTWLDSISTQKIVCGKDVNGINFGVFAVPCNNFGRYFLELIDKERNNPQYARGFKEQQCASDIFSKNPDWLLEPPQNLGWNQYLSIYGRGTEPNFYFDGCWCVHIPGVRNHDLRYKYLKQFEGKGL